jgi:hypothetical protein
LRFFFRSVVNMTIRKSVGFDRTNTLKISLSLVDEVKIALRFESYLSKGIFPSNCFEDFRIMSMSLRTPLVTS